MAGTVQAATQAAIDVAIFRILESAEPGEWYKSNWNDWPHSEQAAVAICYHAKLLTVEQWQGGTTRFKLTAAGEVVRRNRDWIKAAIAEDAEALECDRQAIVGATPTGDSSEAQQAQREKIFPNGREGINPDTIDIALDIFDSDEDTPQVRQTLARKHFAEFADCNARASKALHDLRARERRGRIVLPSKRNRRNSTPK